MEKSLVPRLRVDNLSIHDVGPVSLDIDKGECVGLSGRSGSGKSLFLRAIADMEPHRGTVCLDGTEQALIPAPAWRRKVALLPSESQWWSDVVGDHFAASDANGLNRLGFDPDILAWPVSRLSSGERQRLALLRLLENQPHLLLLDEPTANLDEETSARAEELIRSYRQGTGAAVVWVGHQRTQLYRVASRVFTMEGGRMIGRGGVP
ncbi:ATP-binding cassette domain-containing protein [Desulfosarcina sp.]|uniref:ABC transporter ATP-binding protein n=1 Tax=Desulfosarcina sp. TaxID=2027861 RepID=UPI0035692975